MSEVEYDAPESQALALATQFPDSLQETAPSGPQGIEADPYVGVALKPFSERAQTTLEKYQDVPEEWIDIKPHRYLDRAQLYVSHTRIRKILNEAFGFGGWAVVPVGAFWQEKKGDHVTLYRRYRLYAEGRWASETDSSGDYYTNNPEQNYADAAESAQSSAITRLCKPFCIADRLWTDDAFRKSFKAKWAVQVKDRKGNQLWVKAETPKQPDRADTKESGSGSRVASYTAADEAVSASRPSEASDLFPENSKPAPAQVRTKIFKVTRSAKNPNAASIADVNGEKYWLFGAKHHTDADNALSEGLWVTFNWELSADGKFRNISNFVVEPRN